jgi:hypothetical protein
MTSAHDYPYRWYWRAKHPERHGQPCRVWARGSMNSIGVEFQDGFRTVTARYAIRKAERGAALAPLPAQLDLDGQEHEIAPQTERMRLFKPAPAQLPEQTHVDIDTGEGTGHECENR